MAGDQDADKPPATLSSSQKLEFKRIYYTAISKHEERQALKSPEEYAHILDVVDHWDDMTPKERREVSGACGTLTLTLTLTLIPTLVLRGKRGTPAAPP